MWRVISSNRSQQRASVVALLSVLLSTPSRAWAEQRPRPNPWEPTPLLPALNPVGTPTSEPAAPLGNHRVSFAALTSFSSWPRQQPLKSRWLAALGASVGVHPRITLNATLPVLLNQRSSAQTRQPFGPLWLRSKTLVIRPEDAGGFATALLSGFSLPTETHPGDFEGRTVTLNEQALLELNLLLLTLRAQAGYALRSAGESGLSGRFPFQASVVFRPQWLGVDPGAHWSMMLHARGNYQPSPEASPNLPVLAGGSVSYSWGWVGLNAGAEFGIGEVDPAPDPTQPSPADWHAFLGLQWTPAWQDADADGVVDQDDLCPNTAEDNDGEMDQDGCPEDDPTSVFGAPL